MACWEVIYWVDYQHVNIEFLLLERLGGEWDGHVPRGPITRGLSCFHVVGIFFREEQARQAGTFSSVIFFSSGENQRCNCSFSCEYGVLTLPPLLSQISQTSNPLVLPLT